MLTKKLNTTVALVSQMLTFVITLYFAVLLAKLVWWVINPSISEVYIEKSSANQFDKSIKYIINRYPFGIIPKVVEQKHVAPPIADQVKLTGIYFNPPNSMAFLEYGGKAYTVMTGSKIMDDALLKSIAADHVVVSQNGADATIELSKGSGTATQGSSETSHPAPTPSLRADPTHMDRHNSPANNNGSNSTDDFKERRRKLIEEFAQKQQAPANGNGNANTNSASNNTMANDQPNNANNANMNAGANSITNTNAQGNSNQGNNSANNGGNNNQGNNQGNNSANNGGNNGNNSVNSGTNTNGGNNDNSGNPNH